MFNPKETDLDQDNQDSITENLQKTDVLIKEIIIFININKDEMDATMKNISHKDNSKADGNNYV